MENPTTATAMASVTRLGKAEKSGSAGGRSLGSSLIGVVISLPRSLEHCWIYTLNILFH